MRDLTAETVWKLLDYDHQTGVMTRRVSTGLKSLQGMIAGTVTVHGYRAISLRGRSYFAHRLAWLYMTGEHPCGWIDHIDGCRTNNRWANLRDVTPQVNKQNLRKAHVDSGTGLLGAYRHRDKFRSIIGLNGVKHWLGSFDTAEEAHAVYIEAKRRLHEGNTL